MRAGRHRLSVRVRFVDGSSRTLRGSLFRCAASEARYTG
jgi:hypothetical protein